jgi:transposase
LKRRIQVPEGPCSLRKCGFVLRTKQAQVSNARPVARGLPPYSPDLNPIEKAWAKLKQLLRTAKARTKEALDQAIAQLLPQITAEDAKAWFRAC